MSVRGIVASVGLRIVNPTTIVFNPTDTPDTLAREIRRYATYWDHIDAPASSLVSFPLGPDWDALVAAGGASRTLVVMESGSTPGIFINAQCLAFAEHQRHEPGIWSMAQMGTGFYLPPAFAETKQTLEFELTNCLPVPDDSVPIEKILAFKQNRSPELQALRATIDKIYQGVVSAGDIERARVTARDQIDAVVADLQKSMSESFATRFHSIMKYGYVVANAAAGAFLSGLPLAARAAIAGGSAALGLKIMSSSVPKGVAAGGFSYVQRVVKEVGRK